MERELLLMWLSILAGAGIFFLSARGMIRQYTHPKRPTRERVALRDVSSRAAAFLSKRPADGSFIVFLTSKTGEDGGAGFCQLSVESGEVGIDHVLTAKLNERTSAEFERLLKSEGHEVNAKSENDVEYLRAVTTDGPRLVHSVLTVVLGVNRGENLEVIEAIVGHA